MKLTPAFSLLLALGVSACAHNPRPESPEQRAQQQAQSLQEQNSSNNPQSVTFRDRTSNDEEQAAATPEEQPAQQPVRSRLRQQSAAMRGMTRPVIAPVRPMITGVRGGVLR